MAKKASPWTDKGGRDWNWGAHDYHHLAELNARVKSVIRRRQAKGDVSITWLDTNLKAHYFIPGQYWKNNIDLVKEMLPQAEVYVYENDCQIEGFIGLNDEYMEGIFVRDEMQSQGIGKLLLNFVKEKKTKLYLNVYQKNTRAIHFYQREGFEIQREGLDEVTGEKDYVMVWQRGKSL